MMPTNNSASHLVGCEYCIDYDDAANFDYVPHVGWLCPNEPRLKYYVLENKEVIPSTDFASWSKWMEEHQGTCLLGKTGRGGVIVNTAFVGLDLSWGLGDPNVFVTHVLGGEHDGHTRVYSRYIEAMVGHYETLRLTGLRT